MLVYASPHRVPNCRNVLPFINHMGELPFEC